MLFMGVFDKMLDVLIIAPNIGHKPTALDVK